MKELLDNPLIQAALVTVVVTALNAVVAFIKQKFPTQAALVERNWCYIQPVVTSSIAAAKTHASLGALTGSTVGNIIAKAAAEFAESYKALEGKDATEAELAAARTEITSAVSKAVEVK